MYKKEKNLFAGDLLEAASGERSRARRLLGRTRAPAPEAPADRERLFRTLADNLPDAVGRFDTLGRALYLNQALRNALGCQSGELLGKTPAALGFDAFGEALRRVAADGEGAELTLTVPAAGGRARQFALRVLAERGADSRVESVLALGRDVTDQKRIEEELRFAASVFLNSGEAVIITDADGTIVSVNPAFSEITGYSEREALGRRPSLLRSDRHAPEFYRSMWSTLLDEGRWQGEVWNRRKGGEGYLASLTISRIQDDEGRTVRYVAVSHDITELRRKDDHIRHLAFHDALTGLANRALFHERLAHAIERARRVGERLAVIFLDLDRFKAINDGLGHDLGDLLLQEVASRIQGRLRRADTVARMGGDEFVILMEDLREPGHCVALGEEILAQITRPMDLLGHTVQVSASLGMAFVPEDGDDAVSVMRHADMAMYAAKAAGRNTYRFFQPHMLEQTTNRLRLEMALRNAIPNGEFELHFQPKIALESGRPIGVEALMRWRHPVCGLVPPADFVPVAEECGLIAELGDWLLDAACRQSARWEASGLHGVRIAVNVSARQLDRGDLAGTIAATAARHGISPGLLEVELTEGVVMANPERVVDLFARLRAMGITVAVDDFGTGYSSLAYLRRLPIDVLKIDRSFVAEADRNDDDAQIVKTVLALSKALLLKTVAEGVETAGQAELLRSLGCDGAQGYFYAEPLTARELERWWHDAAAQSAGRKSD